MADYEIVAKGDDLDPTIDRVTDILWYLYNKEYSADEEPEHVDATIQFTVDGHVVETTLNLDADFSDLDEQVALTYKTPEGGSDMYTAFISSMWEVNDDVVDLIEEFVTDYVEAVADFATEMV